jgi:hypothetical protein
MVRRSERVSRGGHELAATPADGGPVDGSEPMNGDEHAGEDREVSADDADIEDALDGHRDASRGSDDGQQTEPRDERPDDGQQTEPRSERPEDPPEADGEPVEIRVPPNLLAAWEHRAETAKLSLSEYVVRMAEAGRMSVQMDPSAVGGDAGTAMTVEQLTDDVVERLRHEDAVSWEQLLESISSNLEGNLEEALERLQEDDVVRYSGLEGGYKLVEDDA